MATILIRNGAFSGAMQAFTDGRLQSANVPANYAGISNAADAFASEFLVANAALIAPMADSDNSQIGQLCKSVCAGVLSGRPFASITASDYQSMAAACAAMAKQASTKLAHDSGFHATVAADYHDSSDVQPFGPSQRHNAFARLSFLTDGTSLRINTLANFALNSFITVVVNGAWLETLTVFDNGDGSQVIALPPGAGKVVDLWEGPQFGFFEPNITASVITSVDVLDAGITIIPPAATLPARRILFYGDSISQGYPGQPQDSYIGLMRLGTVNNGVTSYGSGGRSLYEDSIHTGIPTLAATLVAGLAEVQPGGRQDLIVVIGTNDWGQSIDGGVANFQATLASLVDAVHALNPTAKVQLVSPIYRNGEDVPNSQGNTLPQYRDAMNNVAATRGPWCLYWDASVLIAPSELVDGVHPNADGYATMAQFFTTTVLQLDGVVIDLDTLNGEGYWKDFAGGDTWVGSASAHGGSAGRDLTGVNPPTPGAGLDGHGTALFDGVDDELVSAVPFTTFIGPAEWAFCGLLKMNVASPDAGPGGRYQNPGVWAAANSVVGSSYSTAGFSAEQASDGGVQYEAVGAEPTAVWAAVFGWWDGSYVHIKVNKNIPGMSPAISTQYPAADVMKVGANYNSAARINGEIAVLWQRPSRFKGTEIPGIYAGLKQKFPSAGLP